MPKLLLFHLYTMIIPSNIWTRITKDPFNIRVPKQSSNIRYMVLVSSFFGIRFSQKQLKVIPMCSNKRLPWKFNCGYAGSSSPWNSKQREKICVRTWTTTRTRGKKTKWRKANAIFWLSFAIYSPSFSSQTFSLCWKHQTPSWSMKQTIANVKSTHVINVYYPCWNEIG